MKKQEKLLRPAQFAEEKILKDIVEGVWLAGHKLPPERELSEIIGITRPTLREVLQRLSRDGWLTIKHGKPTTVNNFKVDGGLGVLKTLVNYEDIASKSLIRDWLEFRVIILPELSSKAVEFNYELIVEKLNLKPKLSADSKEFAIFDWDLQILLVSLSRNTIAKMLYNDLINIYFSKSEEYFTDLKIKEKSLHYYEALLLSIKANDGHVESIVKAAMLESLEIWNKTNLN
ncbi:MAG: GntR family transcriptional regulator [Flavobacteriales bacterium]|nr:GntR family transcriptional regulator [Flavobacteriales bacterium]